MHCRWLSGVSQTVGDGYGGRLSQWMAQGINLARVVVVNRKAG